jgi:glutathione S-transferase
MKRTLRIDAEHAATARTALMLAFDRLDERIGARKFLAGPYFSRADLTAAALLFHCWDPQWHAPAGLDEFLNGMGDRPFFQWAAQIYANHRHPAAAAH